MDGLMALTEECQGRERTGSKLKKCVFVKVFPSGETPAVGVACVQKSVYPLTNHVAHLGWCGGGRRNDRRWCVGPRLKTMTDCEYAFPLLFLEECVHTAGQCPLV
ncbi:unnamed protein product [Leuciscus chuanchicus]